MQVASTDTDNTTNRYEMNYTNLNPNFDVTQVASTDIDTTTATYEMSYTNLNPHSLM